MYEVMKRLGLCPLCKKKAAIGHVVCESHLKEKRRKQKEKREASNAVRSLDGDL
jgi:hypothetical protein